MSMNTYSCRLVVSATMLLHLNSIEIRTDNWRRFRARTLGPKKVYVHAYEMRQEDIALDPLLLARGRGGAFDDANCCTTELVGQRQSWYDNDSGEPHLLVISRQKRSLSLFVAHALRGGASGPRGQAVGGSAGGQRRQGRSLSFHPFDQQRAGQDTACVECT